ncbi:hypothetical protein [Buchnera aphidicola]|uniref:hypothetical protein n=1 Tax=Buchnera aphidicola TaxID=9 RepID=UPI0034644D35
MNIKNIYDLNSINQKIFEKINFLFKNQSQLFITTLAFFLSILLLFFIWIFKHDYRLLYKNVFYSKINDIVSILDEQSIPYQFNAQQKDLFVPNHQLIKAIAFTYSLNQDIDETKGFELLDNEKFGLSSFHEYINYQRALAGELKKTIQSLNHIKRVKIHLSIPDNTFFF